MRNQKSSEQLQNEVFNLREELLALREENRIQKSKEFLTRKDVSEYFDISYVTIHDWIHKGMLKPYKMGRRTFFKYSEILDTILSSNK